MLRAVYGFDVIDAIIYVIDWQEIDSFIAIDAEAFQRHHFSLIIMIYYMIL
jgi:hypothetical protein